MWYTSPQWQQNIALVDQDNALTYAELAEAVNARSQWLTELQVSRVAIYMDNAIEWVLFDLACQQANVCCVPVPVFFSQQQMQHLLDSSAIELVICHEQSSLIDGEHQLSPFAGVRFQRRAPSNVPQLPEGTHKITFTSGTTGTPKGVCLSTESQLNVARSLVDAVDIPAVKHLCLLPLATLLENIAGVYSPLMVGGTVYLASQAQRGFQGSRLTQPQAMLGLISQQQPNSLILVPELLSLLVMACRQGWQPPQSLQFIAVGGGKVSSVLIEQARAQGLPVYEGYGLSECASVVSLNTANHEAANSAGAVLPHNQLTVKDGELIVRGNLFLGYLNQPESFYPESFSTGDLVSLKEDYLFVTGRRKNVIINSFGRNISPEWIEAELLASQYFRDVLVFGDAQPYCGALFVPIQSTVTNHVIQAVVNGINSRLPDYARIAVWEVAPQAFATVPGLVTNSGKLVRDKALDHFSDTINKLYSLNNCSNL